MRTIDQIKNEQNEVKRDIETKKLMGQTYEKNRDEYQSMFDDIYASDLAPDVKQPLLDKIKMYVNDLTTSYDLNIQEPIEQKLAYIEKLESEVQENISKVLEAMKELESFKAHSDVDTSSIKSGIKEMNDSERKYENLKSEFEQAREKSLQELNRQSSEVRRTVFPSWSKNFKQQLKFQRTNRSIR